MSEFDGIDSPEGWRSKLKSLMDEAVVAAASEDVQKRFDISERLTQFVENSFPNNAAVLALDKIAKEAAIGLLEKTINERLQSIVARNVELAGLTKAFEAEAGLANKVAASLRLERSTKAVEALNGSIAALKDLATSLKKDDDEALLKSVERTVESAKKLRTLLESA